MKPHLLLIFIFMIFNGILLAFCVGFKWLPMGHELALDLNLLSLQENRYTIKEQNRINANLNKEKIEELLMEIEERKLTILSQSQLIPELTKLKELAEVSGLEETEFYMDEPVLFDTTSQAVMILEVTAVYQGGYNDLCILAEEYLDSVCHVKHLKVSKSDSQMTVSFSLYGVVE